MRKLPLSGSEPMYSDLIYGTPRGIENNNCYAWAFDVYRDSGGVKLQPGNLSHESTNYNASSCKFLQGRAMDDNKRRGIMAVDPNKKCPRGFYKVMSFIDVGDDYHWYKQHKHVLYRMRKGDTIRSVARDLGVKPESIVPPTPKPRAGDLVYVPNAGVFSHKQGFATGPLLRDASARTIPDPRRANRNYGEYNYDTFCGAMCVRNVRPSRNKLAQSVTRLERQRLNELLRKRAKMLR